MELATDFGAGAWAGSKGGMREVLAKIPRSMDGESAVEEEEEKDFSFAEIETLASVLCQRVASRSETGKRPVFLDIAEAWYSKEEESGLLLLLLLFCCCC